MLRQIILIMCLLGVVSAEAGLKNLSLKRAINMLEKNNLEIKISRFKEQMKAHEVRIAKGYNYGKLDLSLSGMRSNDAGNVFGFKMQSREASFADFGVNEFLAPLGQAIGAVAQGQMPQDMSGLLDVQPSALNYPDARNHFQTKLTYVLPLYTGGKLTEYARISEGMVQMSRLDTQKILNEKIFQTKKSFYDISLVTRYITNLSKIINNIDRLENIVREMVKEGYAKNIDILEVEARKVEAQSMLNQAKLNKKLAYQFLSFLMNREVSSIRKIKDMAPIPYLEGSRASKNNIDIQKALLGLKIAKMAVAVEKAKFLPTVGFFAEYGSADNVLFNEFFDKDAYTFGLQLQWNFYNGNIDALNLERAKVNYMLVQDQVILAKKGIDLKVKKLQTEVLSANGDIRNYNKQFSFAKKVYSHYKAQYKEGIVSVSAVLMKQSKELEILLKLLTVKNNRNTKIFELNSILNIKGSI